MTTTSFQQMQEIHYCRLDYQSNVYGLTKFAVSSEENRLLVASLRGKVMSVSFNKTVPSSREVNFTYIPSDAEIISLDAFNRTSPVGVVVAIAFTRINNYLNIYSDFDTGGDFDLDQIALGCQSLDLNFVPYQLYHTEIYQEGEVETVFLLSGSDAKVHMFREARNTRMFVEEQIDECFPELIDLPGIVTRIHCIRSGSQRLTAVGCQNGFVSIAVVNLDSRVVLKMYQIQHDSPITSVAFFRLTNQQPDTSKACTDVTSRPTAENGLLPNVFAEYHLIVTSALELAVVYANVACRGLLDTLVLPDSDGYDCCMCSLAADTDFDGTNEILVGTYGQEVLVYKFQSRPASRRSGRSLVEDGPPTTAATDQVTDACNRAPSATSSDRRGSADIGKVCNSNTNTRNGSVANSSSGSTIRTIYEGEFVLIARRSLPDPVLALEQTDVTGDGLREIVVLSLRGLHVLQHDLKATSELCLRRLQKLNSADTSVR